jgi:hypothetical protein
MADMRPWPRPRPLRRRRCWSKVRGATTPDPTGPAVPAPHPRPAKRRTVLVNAALLLMSSTFLVGADPAPAPAAAPAVATAGCGTGCGEASCGDACCERAGLLDRIRARIGSRRCKSDDCCAPAPTCCAPAPAPKPCCAPAPSCDTCDPCASRPNLLDRLRAHFGKRRSDCCDSCSTCDTGCAPAAPHAAPSTPAPSDVPKPMPKTSGTSTEAITPVVPAPGAVVAPPLPLAPASAPNLNGTTSPY